MLPEPVDGVEDALLAENGSLKSTFARKIKERQTDQYRQNPLAGQNAEQDTNTNGPNGKAIFQENSGPSDPGMMINPQISVVAIKKVGWRDFDEYKSDDKETDNERDGE